MRGYRISSEGVPHSIYGGVPHPWLGTLHPDLVWGGTLSLTRIPPSGPDQGTPQEGTTDQSLGYSPPERTWLSLRWNSYHDDCQCRTTIKLMKKYPPIPCYVEMSNYSIMSLVHPVFEDIILKSLFWATFSDLIVLHCITSRVKKLFPHFIFGR